VYDGAGDSGRTHVHDPAIQTLVKGTQ
jgi:hypothetical protein